MHYPLNQLLPPFARLHLSPESRSGLRAGNSIVLGLLTLGTFTMPALAAPAPQFSPDGLPYRLRWGADTVVVERAHTDEGDQQVRVTDAHGRTLHRVAGDRSSYLPPQRRGNPLPTIIVVVAVSVLLFLVRNWSALRSNYRAGSQDAIQAPITDLHARVTTDGDGPDLTLTVTNEDTFTWPHVIIDVDRMAYSGQHRANTDAMSPGASTSFKLSQVGIRNGMITDVEVYTVKPDGTKTGAWEGTVQTR